MISVAITVITVILAIVWINRTWKLIESGKLPEGQIRGMLKFYHRNELNEEINGEVKKWLAIFIVLSLFAWASVAVFFWNSNLNFIIGIFPFLWHFMVARYFLWEKHDLQENPGHEPGPETKQE